MELIRINSKDTRFQKAYSLLERSFIVDERRDYDELMRVMDDDKYHFNILVENGEYVGIMLTWEFKNSLYLEHFAIEDNLRGCGYGSAAIKMLTNIYDLVILEIEVPDDQLKIKRRDFYLANGFYMNEHHHIQPKYHVGDEDLILLIMSSGRTITKNEYNEFYSNLVQYVQNPKVKSK